MIKHYWQVNRNPQVRYYLAYKYLIEHPEEAETEWNFDPDRLTEEDQQKDWQHMYFGSIMQHRHALDRIYNKADLSSSEFNWMRKVLESA